MKKITIKTIAVFIIIYIVSSVFMPICSLAVSNENDFTSGEEYSEAYKIFLSLSDEEKAKVGAIPNKYDAPYNSKELSSNKVGAGVTSIPTAFVLTSNDVNGDGIKDIDINDENCANIPMLIKNQGSDGLCWAFTSINSLETYLALHGGYFKEGEIYNFSERHLDYRGTDTLKGFDQDWNPIIDRDTQRQYRGDWGNFYNFVAYMINGYGPVLESEVPYDYEWDTQEKIEYMYKLYRRALLTDYIAIPTIDKIKNEVRDEFGRPLTQSDSIIKDIRDLIKQSIMENGSLYAAINSDAMMWTNGTPIQTGGYLNVETDGSKIVLNYQIPEQGNIVSSNHAISIIGWDDNFSKENFPESCRPNSDGAYIAMNSWGEDVLGENNVFYISYEDIWVETQMMGVLSAKVIDPLYVDIETQPSQVNYFKDETFNTTGLVIKAYYQDGTVTNITDSCNIDTTTPLTLNDENVVITYQENGLTYTLKVPISVKEFLSGDINRDGSIKLYDAFVMLRKVIQGDTLSEMDKKIMDFNEDGEISLYDAFCFLRQVIVS